MMLHPAGPVLTREEYVAKRLREAIVRGELKPGERLDQTRVAARLKVSRTPVRNALLILANEGLVKMVPHAGAVVSEAAPEGIEELFFLRGLLEGAAARLAAERMTDEDLSALEETLAGLDAASDAGEWLALNRQFHFRVYTRAGRPRLLSLITSVHDLSLPYSHRYVGSEEHKRNARLGHRRIFEACRLRDGALAEAAIHRHMEAVCKGVIASYAHPQVGSG